MYSYKIIIKENFIFYNNANRKTIITVPLLNLCMRIPDSSMAIGKNGENVMWNSVTLCIFGTSYTIQNKWLL